MKFRSALLLCLLVLVSECAAQVHTPIHQRGYCAMFEECGETNNPLNPGKLNCLYNGPAKRVDDFENPIQFRNSIRDFCGSEFENLETTCCDIDILNTLINSVSAVLQFVGNCEACWRNLKALWCQQSCTPDQSMYYNVTVAGLDPSGSGNTVVLETQYFVDPVFADQLYTSCAETKFGPSNTLAMTFIGGGAKNYKEMLKYMGEPKNMGSPFFIHFPWDDEVDHTIYTPMNTSASACFDDGDTKCACIDCSLSCPVLEPLPEEGEPCMVGSIRCLPFGLLVSYGAILLISFILILITCRKKESYVKITYEENREKEWKIYTWMQKFYYKFGYFVASYPLSVILVCSLLVGVCCVGLINFEVETDPVKLWSGPESDATLQKKFFDENFGPFYRTEQIIISSSNPDVSVMREDVMARLFQIETDINNIVVEYNGNTVTLDSLCYKPLDDYCVIQSPTGYWQSNISHFEFTAKNYAGGWFEHLIRCADNPTFPGDTQYLECLPLFQDPIKPEISLGGFEGTEYENATAFVFTIVITNSLDEEYISTATEWEKAFVDYMKAVAEDPKNADLRITFYSESGVELELASETASDVITIAISYLVMFIYVSIALGRFVSWRRILIDTKVALGIAGVFICIISFIAAVGIFSAFGVRTTLIVAEVIPFLVLAVGVDNIFILVHCFDSLNPNIPVEERAAMSLGEVGPSITLTALSETVAFSLGAIVKMPAVNSFASYSAVAIFIDFLLQITVFLALLCLDSRRSEDKRIDCLPCIKIDTDDEKPEESESFLQSFISNVYIPFLFNPIVKIFVILGFLGLLAGCISYIPNIELGLDQKIALPSSSYLIPYFDDQVDLLKVGVPVYFVIQGPNMSTYEGQREVCGGDRCDTYSVSNIISLEALRPEESYVALNPALWFDDFVAWLNPGTLTCCRTRLGNPDELCDSSEPISRQCQDCYNQRQYGEFKTGPLGEEFIKYIDLFLQAIPGADCALAGKAAYSDAVVVDYEGLTVSASHFRTYHTVLKTQADYINAYKQAIRICDRIEEEYDDIQCFPYSIIYVYFEQYLTIVAVSVLVISLAAAAVFLVTWVILGSFLASLCVVMPVMMIIFDLLGVMAWWNISLNALSLVNIVMALGISVEFCSHLTRAFRITIGTKEQRAKEALRSVGASVFSGITVTKFLGVVVLAFASSEIFVVYYFRMYLTIVFLGFAHGLILLPVLLSYIGPVAVRPIHIDALNVNASYSRILTEKPLSEQQQRDAIYGSMSK